MDMYGVKFACKDTDFFLTILFLYKKSAFSLYN